GGFAGAGGAGVGASGGRGGDTPAGRQRRGVSPEGSGGVATPARRTRPAAGNPAAATPLPPQPPDLSPRSGDEVSPVYFATLVFFRDGQPAPVRSPPRPDIRFEAPEHCASSHVPDADIVPV